MRTVKQIKAEMKQVRKKKYSARSADEAQMYEYHLRTLQIELEQALTK
jgi:hypothetical protein